MNAPKAPTIFAAISWPQETARLLVRPAVLADAEATWAYRRFPQVTHWVTSAWADLEGYRESFLLPERLGTRLVVELDGRVIGEVMVQPAEAWSQRESADSAVGTEAELGWAIDPAFAGRGLAKEALERVLRLCFGDLGLRRVTARCFSGNEPSWRLMERLGMRRESHLVAAALHREHGWMDGYGYALLARDWVTTRQS